MANRVQQIHENTSINQWAYVPTSDNPSDDASRGLDAVKQSPDSRWFNGPSFLRKTEDLWPEFNQDGADIEHDPEVKKDVTVNLLQVSTEVLANGEERVSKWCKWRRIIAWVLLYKLKLLNQLKGIKQ